MKAEIKDQDDKEDGNKFRGPALSASFLFSLFQISFRMNKTSWERRGSEGEEMWRAGKVGTCG